MSCIPNPMYGGLDDPYYQEAPYIDDWTWQPCSPSSSSPTNPAPVGIPQIITTPVGVTNVNADPLSKILQAILSGTALVTRQPAIPTQVSATQYTGRTTGGTLDPTTLALLQRQQTLGGGGNLAGSLQNLITNNSGAVLIGGALFVAFMMKPPRR